MVCEFGGIDRKRATGELIVNQALGFARYQWPQCAECWQITQRDAIAIKAGKAMGVPFRLSTVRSHLGPAKYGTSARIEKIPDRGVLIA